MNSGDELKAWTLCPWCECDDLKVAEDDHVAKWARHYVWCCNCAVAGPRGETAEEAIELWNTRAADKDPK